jgi:3alpha(or 20beta)-hydroxysteroid dehydrogenase
MTPARPPALSDAMPTTRSLNFYADKDLMARRLARIPLGRMGTVAKIVATVLYFASDDSACTSGSELLIDGGAMAQ